MNNLRTLRKEKKLTMKELGQIIGVAESTISLYENGLREPDNATLTALADLFDVSVDYLLGRTNIPTAENSNAPQQTSIRPDLIIPDILQQVGIGFHEGAENLTQEDIDDMALALELSKHRRK